MRIVLLALVLISIGTAPAAEPGSDLARRFDLWTQKELKALEQPLHQKISGPRKNITMTLADYGASGTAIAHREANGPGESHAASDDYFIVQSGEATLLIGGAIVNGRETAPGEIRGDGIDGGERFSLTPGDIVHIGAGVPHQLLVGPGKRFTYFIVRAERSPPATR